MTTNQIAYWKLQEDTRAHLAQEAENVRSARAKEAENYRHNLATENQAKLELQETNRSNQARELETHRHNEFQEVETTVNDLWQRGEISYHNRQTEEIERLKALNHPTTNNTYNIVVPGSDNGFGGPHAGGGFVGGSGETGNPNTHRGD